MKTYIITATIFHSQDKDEEGEEIEVVITTDKEINNINAGRVLRALYDSKFFDNIKVEIL